MKNDAARYLAMSSVCAVALITGCATAPGVVELDSRNTKIEPLYRVEQPAGTAAGQAAVGRMLLAEGRLDAAIKRFRNALALEPGYVEALNGLGVALARNGRYEEAVASFRTALAAAPDSAHLLNNLGLAQLKAGSLQQASVSLGRALELEPHDARTRENVHQLTEARERAAREPVAALTMRPDDTAGTSQVTAETVAVAAPVPVPAPRVQPEHSPGFEVVLAKSSDSVLVQVAPAVYEIRPIAATQSTAAVPARGSIVPVTEARPVATRASLVAIDRLEVSNGAGTNRLATRTARRLAQMGAAVARVTNYPDFGRPYTEIHYRDGHAESATRLGDRLPVEAKLVSVDGLRADVDVRLVVGRDMVRSDVAAWWNETLDLARAEGDEGRRTGGWRHL